MSTVASATASNGSREKYIEKKLVKYFFNIAKALGFYYRNG